MKIRTSPANRAINESGFTLIEMIGVLAVIAILAAVLIPKVFEAINNARVNNAAMTVNAVKTACIDHYAKFGSFPVDGTTTPPSALNAAQQSTFDAYLLKEGFMDKPFQVKIGDGIAEVPSTTTPDTTHTRVQIIAAQTAATVANGANGAYNLDADSSTTPANDANGTWVVEAVITGVQEVDAQALNRAIDGSTAAMGAATGAADTAGRVEYAVAVNGLVEVHIYLTHR